MATSSLLFLATYKKILEQPYYQAAAPVSLLVAGNCSLWPPADSSLTSPTTWAQLLPPSQRLAQTQEGQKEGGIYCCNNRKGMGTDWKAAVHIWREEMFTVFSLPPTSWCCDSRLDRSSASYPGHWVQTSFWPIGEKQNGTNSAIGGGPIMEDDGYLTVQNPSSTQPLPQETTLHKTKEWTHSFVVKSFCTENQSELNFHFTK